MNQFKDFGIKTTIKSFIGDKIKIERIVNREIYVYAWKIEKSKYEKGNEKCLHLQIGIGDVKHVVFTSSKFLQQAIAEIPEEGFPFKTTIVKINDHYEFT